MFGRKRRALTHGQYIRDELAQSYGHLKLAAGHAAGGTAEMMTPAYDRARKVTVRGLSSTRGAFMPLYQQAKVGAATARLGRRHEQKKNRWPAFFGILAAGAAVGAAGAVVVRRRRSAAQWDYESLPPEGETGLATGMGDMKERAAAAAGKVSAGAASVAESVSSGAGKVAESVRGKPAAPGGPPAGKGPDIAPPETVDEAARRMSQDRGQGDTFSAFADESPEGRARP